MDTRTITVFDPTAKPRVKEVAIVPRVHDLNDKVIGFLWNNKFNGDLLLLRIKEQLSQRFRFAGTIWHQKTNAAAPADTATIEELVHNSNMVINAIGDWGACTTWSVHDSIELEKRSKPTVTICSDRFETLAQATIKNLGMPHLPLVLIPHPLGGLEAEEVREKADRIIEDIIAKLTEARALKK